MNAVRVVDNGAVLDRFEVDDTGAALRRLVARLERFSVASVAIERCDGPVVDGLLDADLRVVVVPSRQVRHLRIRYGAAGNKDGRFDAYVLADSLRTDGHRWQPLQRDSDQTHRRTTSREDAAGSVSGRRRVTSTAAQSRWTIT